MSSHDRNKWDTRYREIPGDTQPASVLLQNSQLIPASGHALDLACGLGSNAIYLAKFGLQVEAWDISSVAIARLNDKNRGLALHTQVRDIIAHPPEPESFDLIIVSRFLERSLCPAISAALKPKGLLFYQTFTANHASQQGPRNPAFLLQKGELLKLFPQLEIEVYEERDEALLVARRP